MVHLSFTAPRRDEGAFVAWRDAGDGGRDATGALARDHVLRRPAALLDAEPPAPAADDTRGDPEGRPRQGASSFYKERFADASGFTFVLVGNLDLERTKALVETYLGSLPAANHKETWHDINVQRPHGVAKKAIAKGSEPKSRVSLTFHG